MKLSLNDIIIGTQGQLLQTGHQANLESTFLGLSTDSRKSCKDLVFLALRGDQFDAHQFLAGAVQQNAAALIIDQESAWTQLSISEDLKEKVSVILVSDTLVALQSLSRFIRIKENWNVVGITGSNGKTSTKEFAGAILRTARATHWNPGSFNNHWGVPLSLLQTPEGTDWVISEMGMNHFGEIKTLCEIALPNVVVCTMVGKAHIEFFGTQSEIARAKSEIYENAPDGSIAIFNLADPLVVQMKNQYQNRFAKVLTFGTSAADVYLQLESMSLHSMKVKGSIQGKSLSLELSLFGEQNLVNLMAAACIGLAAGMNANEIGKGLLDCRSAWGRNQLLKTPGGADLIFDAYNANPDSMKALFNNVGKVHQLQGKKIAVLGQMKEMGALSKELHEEVGQALVNAKVSEVYFVGEDHEAFAKGLRSWNFTGSYHWALDINDDIGGKLAQSVHPHDLIFMKASRGTGLEKLLPYLNLKI